MADFVRLTRDSMQALAAAGIGLNTNQPTGSLSNQKVRGQQSDVYAMPVDASQWEPLQVLDVTDPNFGKFLYLPDYSTPGGPDIVL